MMLRSIMYTLIYTLFIHSINVYSLQEKNTIVQDEDSVIITIQEKLKTPEYRKETLPNDFSYLSYLLAYGINNNQSCLYARSVIKLFSNMLKGSAYVNAQAFSDLLQHLPSQLSPYYTLTLSSEYLTNPSLYNAPFEDRFSVTIHGMLYSKFSTEYAFFRQDPDSFLQNLSSSISAFAQEELTIQQTRQDSIKFLDLALNKLLWNASNPEETWQLTKKIAEQIATLLEYNIIDDTNDLDDLYWTLLTRYCYFIELTAIDMPQSFFETVKNDIRENNTLLFALKEQDCIVESKLSYMQRTLIEAQTTAYRYKSGL